MQIAYTDTSILWNPDLFKHKEKQRGFLTTESTGDTEIIFLNHREKQIKAEKSEAENTLLINGSYSSVFSVASVVN